MNKRWGQLKTNNEMINTTPTAKKEWVIPLWRGLKK